MNKCLITYFEIGEDDLRYGVCLEYTESEIKKE